MSGVPPIEIVAMVLVLFLGIGLHEYAHCKFADMAGDPTPSYYGRVTLNLFKHFEPIGSLMMVLSSMAGFGIGWGRPAPMDPRKMRNPRWDFFIAIIAGPISNLLQAAIYAAILRVTLKAGLLTLSADPASTAMFPFYFLFFGVIENLGLFIFNLIPFGPLDGQWLLGLLMPETMRLHWFRFNQRVGMIGLFVVIFLLQRSGTNITAGPINFLFKLLTGLPGLG